MLTEFKRPGGSLERILTLLTFDKELLGLGYPLELHSEFLNAGFRAPRFDGLQFLNGVSNLSPHQLTLSAAKESQSC